MLLLNPLQGFIAIAGYFVLVPILERFHHYFAVATDLGVSAGIGYAAICLLNLPTIPYYYAIVGFALMAFIQWARLVPAAR